MSHLEQPRAASASLGPPRIASTDGELLALFLKNKDQNAFDQLVERHRAMVWRVCRLSLRQQQDAEDAFQATFLLLVRSARTIRTSDSAAGWLYRVAYRTSIRVRRQRAMRREESLESDPIAPPEPEFPDIARRQTAGVLAEELMRLPAKYQEPLVLRYLEGKSRRAIADATDTTVAAVQGRLARGKQLLRRRLVRRGVSLSVAMAAIAARPAEATASVPTHVLTQTSANGMALITGGSMTASAAMLSLYHQGVRAMLAAWFTKPAGAVVTVAAVALLVFSPDTSGDTSSEQAVAPFAIDVTVDSPSETPAAPIRVAQAAKDSQSPRPPSRAPSAPESLTVKDDESPPRLTLGDRIREATKRRDVAINLLEEAEQLLLDAAKYRGDQAEYDGCLRQVRGLWEKAAVQVGDAAHKVYLESALHDWKSLDPERLDELVTVADRWALTRRGVEELRSRIQEIERTIRLQASKIPSPMTFQSSGKAANPPTLAAQDKIDLVIWGGDTKYGLSGGVQIEWDGSLKIPLGDLDILVPKIGGLTLAEAAKQIAVHVRRRTGDAALRIRVSHDDFGFAGNTQDVSPPDAGGSPRVVKTVPAQGKANVDPNLKEFRVTFDRDMDTGGFSFTGSAESGMPEIPAGMTAKWIDQRTCVLPVRLEPGRSYRVGINAPSFKNFRSATGEPAAIAEVRFSTAKPNANPNDLANDWQPDAWNAQAWRFFFGGNQAEAEKLFREILERQPDHLAACNGLGFCLINRGDHKSALPLFQKCVDANPDAPGPLNGLGRTLAAAGDLDGAIDAWKRSMQAMPGQVGAAHMALARVYQEQKDWKNARPLLEAIVAQNPDAQPFAEWLRQAKKSSSKGPIEPLSGGVHVVGAYSRKDGAPLEVSVPATSEPITLVLTSYYNQRWRLKLDPKASLKRVIVAGYNDQNLDDLLQDLPEGTLLDVFTYFPSEGARNDSSRPEDFGEREYFWAYEPRGEEFEKFEKKLQKLTGEPILTFQGGYDVDSAVVGQSGSELKARKALAGRTR